MQPIIPFKELIDLSLIGLHLIMSHVDQETNRESDMALLEKLASQTLVSDYCLFEQSADIESYLGKRMLEARKSVCDLTWKAKISEGFAASDRQVTHQYMDKCIIDASDRIPYREIFVFSDAGRIDKLERRLDENRSGYPCRYFGEDSPIPRLQFVLIDDEEVFFFASAADSPLVAFKSQELWRVFRSYFEAAWAAATPIRDGPSIRDDEVARIREMLSRLQ